MKVYKFGGASVRDRDAISNVASILKDSSSNLLVVVSAMGKTTNALEKIVALAQSGQSIKNEMDQLSSYHKDIVNQLCKNYETVYTWLEKFFLEIEKEATKIGEYD